MLKSRPVSLESLHKAYDMLYNRHLLEIIKLDVEPRIADIGLADENGDQNGFHNGSSDEEDISAMGEVLVEQSIAKVTEDLASRVSEVHLDSSKEELRTTHETGAGTENAKKQVTFEEPEKKFQKNVV